MVKEKFKLKRFLKKHRFNMLVFFLWASVSFIILVKLYNKIYKYFYELFLTD